MQVISNIFGMFSSCCSFEARNRQSLYDAEIEEQHFRDRLASSINVVVLQEDGGKLPCTLHVDCVELFIRITHQQQAREIKFASIEKILHTQQELERVQTSGGGINASTSVAIHLAENKNCIPLSFSNSHEKKLFLNIVKPFVPI